MALKSKYLKSVVGSKPDGVEVRDGSRLSFRVGASLKLAKAGLSQLLKQLGSTVDFIIITNYRYDKSDAENRKTFETLPHELRALLGTAKVGGYELVGHWVEKIESEVVDALERSWLFINGDRKLPPEALLEAAQTLAVKYDQSSFIVRMGGRTTLRGQKGNVRDILQTDNAIVEAWKNIAKAHEKCVREPDKPYGYSELKRVKEHGREQPVFFKTKRKEKEAPESEQAKAVSAAKHEFFVVVPANNSDRVAAHYAGAKYPNWKW